jgi:tRNA (adenine57-N1/adenine58-N1)-methyltransferase
VTSHRSRGPFQPGDQVQLTDPKGRHHTITLAAGKQFHTHKGSFGHDDLIGQPEGTVVTSTGGTAYLALRPLLAGRTVGRVIASPLRRAVRTAELAGLTVTRVDPDLQEAIGTRDIKRA